MKQMKEFVGYLLAMPLQMMGIQGAIGFDLFNAFTVVLDFNNNMLYMR